MFQTTSSLGRPLAQLEEHCPDKTDVPGSIPGRTTWNIVITAQWVTPVWSMTRLPHAITYGEILLGEQHPIDVSSSSVVMTLIVMGVVITVVVVLASRTLLFE